MPEWIVTLAQLASVLLAMVTAGIAFAALRHSRELERPTVVLSAKWEQQSAFMLAMVVENVGRSPAYDVEFDFLDPVPILTFGMQEKDATEPAKELPGLLQHGCPCIMPGQKFDILWGQYGGLSHHTVHTRCQTFDQA